MATAQTAKTESKKTDTRIGALEFTNDFANGYPTDATVDRLYDERDFQRACQAYLWSLPAVSFTSWQRAQFGRARCCVRRSMVQAWRPAPLALA